MLVGSNELEECEVEWLLLGGSKTLTHKESCQLVLSSFGSLESSGCITELGCVVDSERTVL